MQKNPLQPEPYIVQSTRRELADTYTLRVTPSHKKALPRPQPGQFYMLYAFGLGEVPVSISGDSTSKENLTYTIRSVGHITQGLTQLKAGDGLGLRGPFGSSWPLQAAQGHDLLLVAGGLGLAPLRSVLYFAQKHRKNYQRVFLLYGARNENEILYKSEFKQWLQEPDWDVRITLDHASRQWQGQVGVVTTLIPELDLDPQQTFALVCGPELMMRLTIQELCERGIPEQKIYLSMERNMKCAVGFCGHCQFGPAFICKDGPVLCYHDIKRFLMIREL